jgi:predicted nuclease of restriction endonuclease-like RecB superfamily
LEVADSLIGAYRRGLGKKKKVLKACAGELEDIGNNYQFVRGLSFLLDKRSVFKCGSKADPPELRRKVFQATGELGPATTIEQRKRIIERVAAEKEVSPETVEEFFYADLDSELILKEFNPTSPEALLEKYNLSLTQTLLFDSTELKFTISGGDWQKIFYAIKRLGLIYEAFKVGCVWVKIDGPASVFKLTRRYGTAMAKVLPVIIASQEWTVEAKIHWKYTNEICDFKIERGKHHALFGSYQSPLSFDSMVEQDFAARFQALDSGWRLRREPEPVLAGRKVIIPDFSFERQGVKLYMEIVGFWTMDYLLRKIEKLKTIDVNMLIAVDKSLACERLSYLEKKPHLNIVYYHKKISLAPIIRYLQEMFREVHSKQIEFLKNLSVKFTEAFVDFREFAERVSVSTHAVRVALTENPPDYYVVLPDGLLRKDKLEQIRNRLDEQINSAVRLPLSEAARITEKEGVDITSAVEALGYKIVWHGINAEKAEVVKPKKT